MELTDDRKKCKTCVGNNNLFVPDTEGNCVLPPKIIKGCMHYDEDGKCTDCVGGYEKTADGSCKFINCPNGAKKKDHCLYCKPGYNLINDGTCIGYDRNSSSGRNQVKYALLLLLSLLFWKNSLYKNNLILKNL